MPRPPDAQSILEAALLATEGKSQTQISELLHIDQSAVARRLKKAEDAGWLLRPAPKPPSLNELRAPAAELRSARERLSSARLRRELEAKCASLGKATGKPIPHTITIVPTTNLKTDLKSWDRRLEAIGRAAAVRLIELLPKVRRMGILWGKALRALVTNVCAAQPRRHGRLRRRVAIVPLCGQPIFLDHPHPVALSASTLAAQLAECLNGTAPDQLDLAVPASIPEEFAKHKGLLCRFFAAVPVYRTIFGSQDKPGLVTELDTIVTGVGSTVTESCDPWLEARLTAERQDRAHWQSRITGDLGGVLFGRRGLLSGQQKEADAMVRAINDRGLGARVEHFQHCARLANDSGKRRPGVIVVAVGSSKAAVIFSAISEGCVNELVIDNDLARELNRLLDGGA